MFTDRLKLSVALTIGSDAFAIAGGAVTALAFEMTVYGFEASLSFVVSSEQQADAVFPRFISPDLMRLSVTLERLLDDGTNDDVATPLVLLGYVTERSVTEVIGSGLLGMPVVERVYTVAFCDPASAFWSEHFPVELHADAAMAEVLELHKAQGMTLTYDWLRLLEKQDVLCVGLEVDRGASFYDFVIWYVHRFDGVVELDASSGTYRIGGDKSVPATSVELEFDDVGEVRVSLAEPARHAVNVLNAFADAAVLNAPVPNTNGVNGVRRDVIERTPLSATFERRIALETGRLRPGDHGLDITFAKFPENVPTPNGGVTFEERFSAALYPTAAKYRAVALRMNARAKLAIKDLDTDDPSASFEIDLSARTELQSNRTRHLPSFRSPVWPVEVEGRVLSASGGDADRTWFTTANEKDSIFQYRVQVALWNKTIVAPFSPKLMTGHFFFPAYKTQRVLLGLRFDSAEILEFLDWADNAKLSNDMQGNAIALGYKDGNGSLIRHQYEDGMPTLHIERKLGGDQQTIDILDGTLRIVVKEDPLVPAVVPTFDVQTQVEGAKAAVASQVNDSITGVTGQFATSIGGVQSTLDDATAEVTTAVTAAAVTLAGKADAVEGQLQGLGSSGAAAVAAIASKVSDAKAALRAALGG